MKKLYGMLIGRQRYAIYHYSPACDWCSSHINVGAAVLTAMVALFVMTAGFSGKTPVDTSIPYVGVYTSPASILKLRTNHNAG